MIAFDNGPADGDYVRYIDDLLKNAAIAASAGVLSSTDLPDRTRDRLVVDRSRASTATVDVERMARTAGIQDTGFAAAAAPTASATAAAAIASALMSGQMGGRFALATHTKVGLVAIALGAVLVLFGLFWNPLNMLLVVGGVAVIAWAVRMMKDASTRLPSTRSR